MRTGYNDISAESLDMIRAVQCILDFKTSGYELYDNVLGFETNKEGKENGNFKDFIK